MNLIIVESPTKARTLSRFLGKDYIINSTMGHVRDLPKSKIGVDVEHDFAPDYVLVAKKRDTVAEIRKDAVKADKVYLATDPDREGEAIAYHVREILSTNSKSKILNSKFTRIVFHEITEHAVKEALTHPREIDIPLVDAQQARRVLDRLVGYKLSPLLWKKIRIGLSAGRVQSVTVRLIVEREREIKAFNAMEYWEINTVLRTKDEEQRENTDFTVKLIKIDGIKVEIKNGEQANSIVANLKQATYKVESVVTREVIRRPSPPFTTSTMAQAASRTFSWSAKKAMSVAQRLYEEGLITYHRTDSTNLSVQSIDMARTYIKSSMGERYLPAEPRLYKTKSKVAQEAHEAIRPTDVSKQVSAISNQLGRDEEKLYSLIWKRFLASQMADCIFDETIINVEAEKYLLQAKGEIMKFDGWRSLYKGKEEVDVVFLPPVQENKILELVEVKPEQKFTLPPARYTEASIVKTLEKLGIGRPSTYAPTISTIQDRQYVEKVEGKFFATALGIGVNDFLVKYFSDIVDYQFTAHMEATLDEIANGEKKWVPVIKEFWGPFSKKLEGVEETAERVKLEVEETGEMCSECGQTEKGSQVVRVGKFGKFLSCSRFPDCKWRATYVEKTGQKCPDCKTGDVVVKKTKRGKRFFGCSTYPKCKWAAWKKPEHPIGAIPVTRAN